MEGEGIGFIQKNYPYIDKCMDNKCQINTYFNSFLP